MDETVLEGFVDITQRFEDNLPLVEEANLLFQQANEEEQQIITASG
jgi:hypothetical protein